jgi:hypothetical protein
MRARPSYRALTNVTDYAVTRVRARRLRAPGPTEFGQREFQAAFSIRLFVWMGLRIFTDSERLIGRHINSQPEAGCDAYGAKPVRDKDRVGAEISHAEV